MSTIDMVEKSTGTDRVMPNGAWKFDAEVTKVFDDMLRRSIPQYDVMRDTCFEIASRFQQDHTDIVDLGCSRGEAIARLVSAFGAHNRFVGIEISQPMLAACRERFQGYIDVNVVDIRDLDLREAYPPCHASVTLSVLTLMFVPIEHRMRVVRDVYKHTAAGGAFILVEKVIGSSADLDKMMVEIYHGMKKDHGYTTDQIERKRLSLEGVLMPVTARWNEELLRSAGFQQVEPFWRWMNFCGWVAVK